MESLIALTVPEIKLFSMMKACKTAHKVLAHLLRHIPVDSYRKPPEVGDRKKRMDAMQFRKLRNSLRR